LVFNKADRSAEAARLAAKHPGALAISAATGEGVEELLRAMADRIRAQSAVTHLVVPYSRGDVLAALHREGEVMSEEHAESATLLRVRLDWAGLAMFAPFVAHEPGGTESGQT